MARADRANVVGAEVAPSLKSTVKPVRRQDADYEAGPGWRDARRCHDADYEADHGMRPPAHRRNADQWRGRGASMAEHLEKHEAQAAPGITTVRSKILPHASRRKAPRPPATRGQSCDLECELGPALARC